MTDELFARRGSATEVESGLALAPKFGADGCLPAVASDARTGEVLMLAYMNAEALAKTIETGIAHYWSRSRGRLWLKGEESGNVQRVVELRTDCDQDAIWLRVEVEGHGATCHTGHRSCFYRAIPLGAAVSSALRLEPREDKPLFDPARVYKPR